MKERLAKHFRERWQDYGSFLLMIIIIFGMLYHILDLGNMSLDIPMMYNGGDDAGVLVNAKQLTEQGWVLTSDRLGAPFSTQFYDFTSTMMHNAGQMIMKIFAVITRNAAAAVNLTYLSIFFTAGIISFFVMRNLKINCWIASLASSVFALSPYMLYRNISHIVLTECYFVPLSVLLCVWIYERDDVLVIDKNFFKKKINYVVLLFAFLIANNGIAYYPFFTCFMLMVTAVSKLVKTGKPKRAVGSVLAVAMICFFVVLEVLPGKIYNLQNGANPDAVVRSGFDAAELYGLKIAQMFMPVNGHGIYDFIIDSYNSRSLYVNENVTAYLGVLGMIGFIMLMLCLFTKKDSPVARRLGFLSELNISLVLLGTVGGLGAMFAFFVSPMLRCYNRVSIFIEYVCILAVAVLMDAAFVKLKEKCRLSHGAVGKKAALYASYAVFALVCVFSIWEGAPGWVTPDYASIEAEYTSDDRFVKTIEASVDEGAMIYQLPYHGYPEEGYVNDMADYQLFVGYIHSDTLKWSYGSVKGRDEDAWNEAVSKMDYASMVSYLKEQGFAGIYIDRRAYTSEEQTELESNLAAIIGDAPLVSENGNLSFFKF